MLYLAKYRKLKIFLVQIQWEFTIAVSCPLFQCRGWGKHSDGIAPDRENAFL